MKPVKLSIDVAIAGQRGLPPQGHMNNGSRVLSRSVFVGVLITGVLSSSTIGITLPSIDSVSSLEGLVEDTYTSTNVIQLIQPPVAWNQSLGYYVAEASFEASFLNQLVPVSALGAQVYPVHVIETAGPIRERHWMNATGGIVQVESLVDDPIAWIHATYGIPPGYMNGTTLDDWYADRDRSRMGVHINLILPADVAVISNVIHRATEPPGGTETTFEVRHLARQPDEGTDLYIVPPTGIDAVDLYETTDLVLSPMWNLSTALSGPQEPMHYHDSGGGRLAFWYAGDASTDLDGDLLPDAREITLYGTDADLEDSESDGASDWEELFVYETDPNDSDSDDDGLPDGLEVEEGLDPTQLHALDFDGDGMSNADEVFNGTDPLRVEQSDTSIFLHIIFP